MAYWDSFCHEFSRVCFLAGPMVAAALLQYLVQVSSVMMVGHLGKLALSSVAIATSLTNVTGFSLLSGLVGGLETLCGQAYGAQQYEKLGTYLYTAIISLFISCLPICLLWVFMDKFLILIGQDPLISHEARNYSLWLIPSLFGGAIVKPIVRFLQTQSLILPMLAFSFAVLCVNVVASWVMIFKLEMGTRGAAIAVSFSTWLNAVMLVMYVMYSKQCASTRVKVSFDAFRGISEFFRFAIPSAVMVCLKWWSLEVIVLLSGLLTNPELETSVLSICLTISTLHFTIPYGIGAAASTRVSNELGRGKPEAARVSAWTATFLGAIEAIVVSTGLLLARNIVGRAYSKDKQVVNYIATMAPLICISIAMDSIQAVISGIARGSGWQHIGAYVNLGAFYLAGIPIAIVLGFVVHMKAKGLWVGIVVGSVVQSTILSIITGLTDWNQQAIRAKERLCNGSSPPQV